MDNQEKANLVEAFDKLHARVMRTLGEEMDSVLEQFVGLVRPPTEGKSEPEEVRGIRIPFARQSWELVCEALTYVVEKPHLDDLEESRAKLGGILRWIRLQLDMPVIEK